MKRKAARLRRASAIYRLSVLGAVVMFIGVASGCALTTEHIHLAYQPQTGVSPLKGADATTVQVNVKDERTSTDIAHKVNGYNVEMAPIIADNDIPELIKNSIDAELTDRGFKLGDSKVLVVAELQNFRNHFQVGFFSGTATADLAMNVKVAGPDRQIIYDEHFIAQGVNPGIQCPPGTMLGLRSMRRYRMR
jgi:uncharacterized lipoprotein